MFLCPCAAAKSQGGIGNGICVMAASTVFSKVLRSADCGILQAYPRSAQDPRLISEKRASSPAWNLTFCQPCLYIPAQGRLVYMVKVYG